LAARAREAEPRGQLLFPHDRALHRIDPHQAVGAVAVVRDHQRPVRQRHEAHRQCAYAHAPAGRADTPPRGQQRGAVTQPAGHDTGGEQGQAGERGQSVLLEDYVGVRPERETDIKALVKTGRLQVGPWYVLPDEQIPSGEGLVRNLLLGAADAERWGGRLDVLYSPDAFGHPAAWPT